MDCHDEVITLDNISFSYSKKKVIDQLNFKILERDFVGLIGSNGAGKTTLLKMIAGLLKPDQGEIRLFGQAYQDFKDWERIGYVPQKTHLNPLFPATVKEVVLSGLYNRKKIWHRVTKQDLKKAEDAMAAMGIEDLAKERIGKLSGGQQQRAFLSRAIINNPDLLILDEPTVGIDAQTQENFFGMLQHMHQQHRMTFLMVSHDLEMMYSYLGHQAEMECGKMRFYVKHSHELDDCGESDLTHAVRQAN